MLSLILSVTLRSWSAEGSLTMALAAIPSWRMLESALIFYGSGDVFMAGKQTC